jgi:hypothetical protein
MTIKSHAMVSGARLQGTQRYSSAVVCIVYMNVCHCSEWGYIVCVCVGVYYGYEYVLCP